MNLDLQRLTQALNHYVVGHTIDYHQSLPSTMPVAHQLAAQATTRAGTIVVAEEQTAGRGRLQRRWDAPPGQALLVSIICKPPLLASPILLAMSAGLAAVDALEAVEPALVGQVGLKWPNDVLLGQPAGKVAGLLAEGVFEQGKLVEAILGIGMNVNQTLADLPAASAGAPAPTSVRCHLGRMLDRTTLLIALCQALSAYLATPLDAQALQAKWRSRLWTLGQWVTITTGTQHSEIFAGKAIDVTPEGSLMVEDATGQQRTFATGDVSVRTAST